VLHVRPRTGTATATATVPLCEQAQCVGGTPTHCACEQSRVGRKPGSVHAFKLCTKFERNRIIHRRVIDDLVRFRRGFFFGGSTTDRAFSGVCGLNSSNLAEAQGDHGNSALFEFRYIAAFSNAGGSKLNNVENDAKFRTSLTRCQKIRGGVGESLYQLLKLYLGLPPTETPEYI